MAMRFTSLNKYSEWDGSQLESLDANEIMSALSDDLMEFGDLQQAMRYLMQRGIESTDGSLSRVCEIFYDNSKISVTSAWNSSI